MPRLVLIHSLRVFSVVLAMLSYGTAIAQAPQGPTEAMAAATTFKHDTLTIAASSGMHVFHIEVAETPIQQEIGLMYRKSVPADSGMLFIQRQMRRMPMWMQNTEVPLDMLFIDDAGRIIFIANAKPYSTDVIDPGKPVRAVLEVAGGTASRLGLHAGDTVRHAYFKASAP